MADLPTPTRGDEVDINVDAGNADVDVVFLRESKIALDGIKVLETAFLGFRFPANDENGYVGGDEYDDDYRAAEAAAFRQLKDEMRYTQATLHTLAEDNIAFKSEYYDHHITARGDKLKARIAKSQELARRFNGVIEKFEERNSMQLNKLEKWLHTMIQGTGLQVAESEEDMRDMRDMAVDYFVREVEQKEGENKAALVRVCFEDKKILQDRIYYLKHLIGDTNTILTVQEGILIDINKKAGEDGVIEGADRGFWGMPFWVVFSWMLLLFLAFAISALGVLMKYNPQLFGLAGNTTPNTIMGAQQIQALE